MRVLWITNTPPIKRTASGIRSNGAGWIVSLENELKKREQIELGITFQLEGTTLEPFRNDSVQYFPLPVLDAKSNLFDIVKRWQHPIETNKILPYIQQVINDFKPDVIQIFGTEYPYGLIIPSTKVPVVIQLQGNLTICGLKWFAGISSLKILRYTSLKTLVKAYGLWHLYYIFNKRAKRERELMRDCQHYIGRTDWDRRITNVFSKGRNYYHCDELLRNEFYLTEPWQYKPSEKVILISTISAMAYKGLENILDTAVLLQNNLNLTFEWNVAGVTGNEEIVQIISKVRKCSFADFNITFLGSLQANDLIEKLKSAHFYIHPSHIENSPNSVCEAMMVGMPIVATFAGGTSSIVANGVEGILVQDGDPYMMAGTISEFSKNTQQMISMASNARATAMARHNREKVAADMEEIYKTIIQNRISAK
jgi:glycosyltransferase involved in cell wall biosynthesis